MKNQDIRWVQRFRNYQKALSQLGHAVELSRRRELSALERQGLIQAFEYTHELAWNTLKDFLESRGTTGLFGPRDVTRAAFSAGLIVEGDVWMRMIQSRNQTAHTYNEETVGQIVQAVTGGYADEFSRLETVLKGLQEKEAGVTPQSLRLIHEVFSRHAELEKAALYGSRAKGTFKPGSDIDLALFGDSLTPEAVSRIATELDEEPVP